MGFLKDIAGSIKDKIDSEMAARKAMEEEIRNSKSTEAACAYFKNLFEKDHTGYQWLKQNRGFPIYPVIEETSVKLCYMETTKNAQSFKEAMPKDISIFEITYQEMNAWYGLSEGEGYTRLGHKLQRNTLLPEISQSIGCHPHIKKNGSGYVLKLFG